ncbi:MAG TPA: response regulator [Candidatus Sulfotelmatobacter sp.]|nr:response regulator [Candidatus Sulfotelmatobacter sp.]
MHKTKLLVADDDPFFQTLMGSLLAPDYDLIIVHDGKEAWRELQKLGAPRLAILDWVMPGFSGPQICRKIRASNLSSTYLILLTARNNESDIVAGLRAGADDYITKPPIPAELRARIKMGERVLALQDAVKVSAVKGNGWSLSQEREEEKTKVPQTDYTIGSAEPSCQLMLTGDNHE